MPHDRPFTTLLHPDQALTAEQAAGWVTDLIDYYSQSVSALYHDTLPEEALPGYTETLRSLLECAGALEQHLCGMCFFLPNQLSRAVVAITVAAYYQSALLDAFIEDPEADACVVIDVETLENMSLYLQRVSAYIDTLRDWLASEGYLMLQGVAKKAVSVMRNRIASATGSPGRHDTPPYVPRSPRSTRAKSKAAEVPFARLESFLRRLSQDHFLDEPSPSTSTNTAVPPFDLSDAVAGPSRVAGPSSPTATTPSPFHISLPELELTPQEFPSERRPSLTSSDTTCVEEPTLDSPFHLEAKICSSADPEQTGGAIHNGPTPNTREAQAPRQSLKRRRRTTSTFASSSSNSTSDSNSIAESSRPRKRHKRATFNLRTFGLVDAEDVETYDSAYVGRAVPVRCVPKGYDGAPRLTSLPSRNISISPSASQTSAALRPRSLSPLALEGIPPPSPSGHGVPSVWLDASVVPQGSSMLLEHEWQYGMAGSEVEVDAREEGGESDRESFTTADEGLYADVEMEDGDEHDAGAALSREDEARADSVVKVEDKDGLNAPPRASSPPPLPVLSSKAKGKRRCFAGIFHTFRHIFNSGR